MCIRDRDIGSIKFQKYGHEVSITNISNEVILDSTLMKIDPPKTMYFIDTIEFIESVSSITYKPFAYYGINSIIIPSTPSTVSLERCTTDTDNIKINLTPNVDTLEFNASNTFFCGGEKEVTLTIDTYQGVGQIEYRWLENTSELATTVDSFYKFTTAAITSENKYSVRILDNGCVSQVVDSVFISVNALQIVEHPKSKVVCLDQVTNLKVSVKEGDNLKYQWQSSNSQNGPFVDIEMATAETFLTPSTSLGKIYYRVFIDDNDPNCPGIMSDIASVEVLNPTPISIPLNNINGGGSYCQNQEVQLELELENDQSQYSFQWQKFKSNSFINIDGATEFIYTVEEAIGTIQYRVLITDNRSPCSVFSSEATVTFTQEAQFTIIEPVIKEITICKDQIVTLQTSITNGSGSYSYKWETAESENGQFAVIEDETFDTYAPPTSMLGEKKYRVIIDDITEQCSGKTSQSVTVKIVNAIPIIQDLQDVVNVCTNITSKAESVSYTHLTLPTICSV